MITIDINLVNNVSDSKLYSGVELRPWPFQWDLTLHLLIWTVLHINRSVYQWCSFVRSFSLIWLSNTFLWQSFINILWEFIRSTRWESRIWDNPSPHYIHIWLSHLSSWCKMSCSWPWMTNKNHFFLSVDEHFATLDITG